MSELDPMIRDYYEDQDLDKGVMDRLLEMEAAATPTPKGLPWWRYAALAASVMLVAGVATTGASLMFASGDGDSGHGEFATDIELENIQGIAGFVEPGDEVDLLIIRGGQATTVAQSVRIEEMNGRRVRVSADPSQSAQIADAKEAGELRLALRNDIDLDGDLDGLLAGETPQVSRDAIVEPSDSEDQMREQLYGLGYIAAPTHDFGSREVDEASLRGAEENARIQAEAQRKQAQDAQQQRLAGHPQVEEDRMRVHAEAAAKAAEEGRLGAALHAEKAQELAAAAAVDANFRTLEEQAENANAQLQDRVAAATPTRLDPLSTFSVDVDTASWTRTAKGLSQGYLPAADEVRIEEFVNAFRYDYEGPGDGPFAASIEVVPSPWDPAKHLVRVGLQGKRVSVFERKAVHLTLLVDVSGSMSGQDRLPLLKRGLSKLVGELKDGDTVAIVTYAGNTRVALAPTPISQRQTILDGIRDLSSSGGTAMGAGIDLAYGLATETLERGAINRVVIASDGDANVGVTDADLLVRKIRTAADKGITLTTLGFGNGNYRDDMMEKLADKGDGAYHWIGDDRDAKKVLVDDLMGTLQVIARDVKIQLEFDPDAVSDWRQLGYENRRMADRDFRNDSVDAGEVGSGHQVTALYEVTLTKASNTLGELRVRYERPGAEGAPAVERSMSLVATPRKTMLTASNDTRVAVVAAAFADRLRGRPGVSLDTLDDLLPIRPEYREQDDRLRAAIQAARRLGVE